jgi:hypothetical protein
MEFEEMKKVWDTQANEPMYVINESALRNSIARKRDKGLRITNISEILSIVAYNGVGIFLITNGMFVLAAWMIFVGLCCLVGRIQRKLGEKKYDRTMLGDLDHAVSVANYQVRFSGLMRWNIIPVGALISFGLWNRDHILILLIGIIVFVAVTFYASGWEHNYYKERRKQIVELRDMLLTPKNVV